MRILIDTNVVLDIILKREPFFEASYRALRLALERDEECFISATAATDIFYVLRKSFQSREMAKAHLHSLSQLAQFTDVQAIDIANALISDMGDFEDAVVDAVATRIGADYVLTRNVTDFQGATVAAIPPSDFIERQQD